MRRKAEIINEGELRLSDGRKCSAQRLKIGQIVEVEIIKPGNTKYHVYKENTKPGEILWCFDNNNYISNRHIQLVSTILEEGEEL